MMATATAICCSSFLLGILFTSFLYDQTVLFGSIYPVPVDTLIDVEEYYLTWWNGAVVVKSFLHVVFLCDVLAVASKVASFSDETIFFSGFSLVLLIGIVAMYITVTVPYIRAIAKDPIIESLSNSSDSPDLFTKIQDIFSRGNSGPLGDHARKIAANVANAPKMSIEDKTLHISVMCAANTIIVVLLLGVIILQIGEWYTVVSIVEPVELQEREALKVSAEKKVQ